MSIFEEKAARKTKEKTSAHTGLAKEAAQQEKLQKGLGPKFFEASRKSLKRFDGLYRLLAK